MEEQDQNSNAEYVAYSVSSVRALPQTGSHAFTHFSCTKSELSASALLEYCARYPHIEEVDVSHNELESLETLHALKYLRWLNASHNKLSAFDIAVEWDVERNTGNKVCPFDIRLR